MDANNPADDSQDLPEFFQDSGNFSTHDASFNELEPSTHLPHDTSTTQNPTSRDMLTFIWSKMIQTRLQDQTTKTSPAA